MTKEQLIDVFIMRLDGYTFQEIAKKYDVSKQFIHDELKISVFKISYEKIIYTNIRTWIIHNKGESVLCLAKKLNINSETLRRRLYGKAEMSIEMALKLSALTGLTLEQVIEKPAPVGAGTS